MTALPERLLALLAASEPTDAAERADGDPAIRCTFVDMRPAEFASLIREAAQSLQAQEVVKETTINHSRDPHCCGCYVIRWNDGDPVAVCGECGVQVALLDRLVAPEGWVLVPRVADGYTRHMMKRIETEHDAAISWTAIIAHCERLAAPSPSAALQAGEIRE